MNMPTWLMTMVRNTSVMKIITFTTQNNWLLSRMVRQVMIIQEKSSVLLLLRTMNFPSQVVAKKLPSWHLCVIKTMKVSLRNQTVASTVGV
mgnify:CR=1 FL=1